MEKIRLTESQLRNVIKESVYQVLAENSENENWLGNVGNAVGTAWRGQGNITDRFKNGYNKFNRLQDMDKKIQQYGNAYNENGFGPVNNVQQQVNQLKQEIQQKTEQLDDLEKQLATNNSNGQMSRNMGNLRRQMGGNDYGMARTSYKNGLDANQYDRRYGTR